MPAIEYLDLYEKAQNNPDCKYHIFTWDIVGSKEMDKKGLIPNFKMHELMYMIYSEIEQLEKRENRKILLREDVVSYEQASSQRGFGMLYEPFVLGDAFGFTVYTGSITEQEIINIYEACKKKLNIDFDFHLCNLFYETNNYGERGRLFFRGYAIELAFTKHKFDEKDKQM